MADEPSWDEIFTTQPGASAPGEQRGQSQGGQQPPLTRRELRESEARSETRGDARTGRDDGRGGRSRRTDDHGLPPRKKKRRLTWLWIVLPILVVLIGGGTAAWIGFGPQIRHVLGIEDSNDYVGTGEGKVVITIKNGQIGGDVAKTLQQAGVTKSVEVFYTLLVKNPSVSFEPGSYALKKGMSAKSALAALTDPKNKVFTQLVLPEGITVKQVIDRLAEVSDVTNISRAQLEAAAADYTSYGLPADAVSLEGYLFPATYSLDPGQDAHQIFQTFVTEMFKRLDAAGVAPADRQKVLTLASITQKEGGSSSDFYKVARVWDNRIAQGMHLQSDATVSYGVGGTTISTTDAERADAGNKYNTYANPGLPIGPISNPGSVAIDATLHPADGPWLFFVLVNGDTGETAFSTTLAEHNVAVKQWQAWLKQHPGFAG